MRYRSRRRHRGGYRRSRRRGYSRRRFTGRRGLPRGPRRVGWRM